MEWRGRRGSRNIEDRRGSAVGRTAGVGGVGAVVVVLIGLFLGVDLTPLLQGGGVPMQQGSAEITPEDQAAAEFVSVTLADTEQVWTDVFRDQLGRTYQPATLVLFKGVTESPCGGASGATGPFYCPIDRKAYLDTEFFATLEQRLGARGDFAAAYVVAHEIGHHVQNELGILGRTMQVRREVSPEQANEISVRVELQADCLSGIWARGASDALGTIEPGDLDEALTAARQIGDDTLQRNAGRRPMPHTFTHGTSDQRERWFATGYESGRIEDCDTFSTDRL
jgi:uncharacterized protein